MQTCYSNIINMTVNALLCFKLNNMHCLNSVTGLFPSEFRSLTVAGLTQSPVMLRGKKNSVLAGCREWINMWFLNAPSEKGLGCTLLPGYSTNHWCVILQINDVSLIWQYDVSY